METQLSINIWRDSDRTIVVSLDRVDSDGNVESSATLRTFDADASADARAYADHMSSAKAPDKWREIPTTLPVYEAL